MRSSPSAHKKLEITWQTYHLFIIGTSLWAIFDLKAFYKLYLRARKKYLWHKIPNLKLGAITRIDLCEK